MTERKERRADGSVVIATRESALALWQARHVQAELQQLYPGRPVSILGMTTEGDRNLGSSLAKIGGKGLFVKELETAMLEGRADLAVHSMKDVPVDFPEGLGLAVICEREDPAYTVQLARDGQLAEPDRPGGSRGLAHVS